MNHTIATTWLAKGQLPLNKSEGQPPVAGSATCSASRLELTMTEWQIIRRCLRSEANSEMNSRRQSMGLSMYPNLMDGSKKREADIRKLLAKVRYAGRPNAPHEPPPTGDSREPKTL